MNTIKKLIDFLLKRNTNSFPWLTKALTFTIMPISCCYFLYFGYYYSTLTNKQSRQEESITGIITSVEKVYYPSNRKNQSRVYDIVFSLDSNNIKYNLSSIMPQNSSREGLIKDGAACDILFELEKGENRVVQMVVDNKAILLLAEKNNHFKTLRNLLFFMGFAFTLWFLSRVYRYIKYGNLNWSDSKEQNDLI